MIAGWPAAAVVVTNDKKKRTSIFTLKGHDRMKVYSINTTMCERAFGKIGMPHLFNYRKKRQATNAYNASFTAYALTWLPSVFVLLVFTAPILTVLHHCHANVLVCILKLRVIPAFVCQNCHLLKLRGLRDLQAS